MKSRYAQLMDKSVECMVGAIEIYNKPDFKYREDTFCILAVNAWELLLKAKILKNNKNKLQSIYVKEYKRNKNGQKTRRLVYKMTRSNNNFTIDIKSAMRCLKDKDELDDATCENIEALVELRDNSIHFINKSEVLSLKIGELGMAAISNYNAYLFDWFAGSMGKYNVYLMPMALINEKEFTSSVLGNQEKAVENVLKYISEKEKLYPSDVDKRHNLTVSVDIKLVKASKIDESKQFAISSNGDGLEVNVSPEDISKIYPIEYRGLVEKLKSRYKNFKVNSEFYEYKKNLEGRKDLCYAYPLNPKNPDSQTKKMYSSKMIKAFDNYYELNDEG